MILQVGQAPDLPGRDEAAHKRQNIKLYPLTPPSLQAFTHPRPTVSALSCRQGVCALFRMEGRVDHAAQFKQMDTWSDGRALALEVFVSIVIADFEEVVYFREMAQDPRFDRLDKRINALSDKIDKAQPPSGPASSAVPKETFLKRNAFWLQWVVVVFGNGIALALIASAANNHIDSRVGEKLQEPLNKLNSHGETLANINGRLTEISDLLKIVVKKEMAGLGALPQQQFDRNLDEVKAVLAVAHKQNIQAPENVAKVQEKLERAARSSPEFWGAASALVNYKSPASITQLPDCLTNPPSGKVNVEHGSDKVTIVEFATYSKCEIRLDDPRAGSVLTKNLIGSELILRDCLVRWSGGPILLPPKTAIKLTLINCSFDFSANLQPDSKGQALLSGLIKSNNPASVTVSLD